MKKRIVLIISFVFALGLLAGCASGTTATTSAAASADAAASASADAAASASADAAVSADAAASASADAAASASADAAATSADAAASGAKVTDAAMAYWKNYPAEGNNQVAVDKIFEMMDNGDDILLLDIRSADDYAAGHLRGAVNIPYGKIGESLEMIPDDKEIYVGCYSGQTASQTAALLCMAGKTAHNMIGGWKGGVEKVEGFENYVDTEAVELPAGSYAVDPEIKAAIVDYYAAATSDEAHKNFHMPADEVNTMVEDGTAEGYTILDVRKAEDYDAGHIAGAINIPLGAGMQENFGTIDNAKPVIVYCYSGQTASQVVATLRMLGYEAYNLVGGMGKDGASGWLEKNYPVVTSEEEMAKAA